jgi:hypothetical protein
MLFPIPLYWNLPNTRNDAPEINFSVSSVSLCPLRFFHLTCYLYISAGSRNTGSTATHLPSCSCL